MVLELRWPLYVILTEGLLMFWVSLSSISRLSFLLRNSSWMRAAADRLWKMEHIEYRSWNASMHQNFKTHYNSTASQCNISPGWSNFHKLKEFRYILQHWMRGAIFYLNRFLNFLQKILVLLYRAKLDMMLGCCGCFFISWSLEIAQICPLMG